MNTNLSHPDNAEANKLAQCQRVAALWANQLKRGKITRLKVEQALVEHSEQEQASLRHWLNIYREKARTVATPKKHRTVPHWVRKR